MGLLKRKLTAYYLSPMRKTRLRVRAEKMRQRTGAPHLVEYFHQADDPYSVLAALVLPALQERYDIQIKAWSVPPPDTENAPMADALAAYARKDAELLAAQTGLTWPLADTHTDLPDGQSRRAALGHYQGAMFFYGGEWYWGLDRLHFLERRLRDLGAAKSTDTPFIFSPPVVGEGAQIVSQNAPVIDFYLSLRSPYTYLAAAQIFDLARRYGAQVNLKPVLPMVMRGLPVPKAKRLYIAHDAARQAARLGLPFGDIADPLGRPVERGMAVLALAMDQGKGEAFTRSFLRGVWSEGIEAGRDKGLRQICCAAGLDWQDCKAVIDDQGWRDMAMQNQEDLLALGLWGVPTFALDSASYWGEDRLWAVENQLKAGR